MPTRRLAALAALVALLTAAGAAVAGTAASPEIEDPAGDGVHYEFRHQEPSLDVTKVWFTWGDDTLHVHLAIDDVGEYGAAGTEDPTDSGTRYDVYWTMDGERYVARLAFCTPRPDAGCSIPSDGDPVFLAGQSMRVERKMFWDRNRDIHGDLAEQPGGVAETGAPGHVRIDVDPATVGAPGPGSVLEDPAFSTYVDHHNPGSGSRDGPSWHHPGHVDLNDSAGADFRIPGGGDAGTLSEPGATASTSGDASAADANAGDTHSRALAVGAGLFLVFVFVVGRVTGPGAGD